MIPRNADDLRYKWLVLEELWNLLTCCFSLRSVWSRRRCLCQFVEPARAHDPPQMKEGENADIRNACAEFLAATSEFYRTPNCNVRVLAARPLRVRENWATELFGDYNPETMLIRVWMRTAVRKEITSSGTFLSTLCHEFCHHLDFQRFAFPDSWHTRGFYERTATLYHYARDTAPKRLFWAPVSGGRWRIDWPRTNRGA